MQIKERGHGAGQSFLLDFDLSDAYPGVVLWYSIVTVLFSFVHFSVYVLHFGEN